MIMASHCKAETEETMVPKVEPDLDNMAQQVQNCFNYEISVAKWILIQKSTWLLQKQSLSSLIHQEALTAKRLMRRMKFEEDAVIFL